MSPPWWRFLRSAPSRRRRSQRVPHLRSRRRSQRVPHLRRSQTVDGLVDSLGTSDTRGLVDSLGTSDFRWLQVAFFPNPAPDLSDDHFDYGATLPEPTQQEIEEEERIYEERIEEEERIDEVRFHILMRQRRERRMQPTLADFGLDWLNREDGSLFVGGEFSEEVRECPPAKKSVVEGLKEVVEEGNVMCVVCKDEMQGMVKELPCSHRFHGDCIVQWFGMRNTCPVCRFELPTDDAEYEAWKARRGGGGNEGDGRDEAGR